MAKRLKIYKQNYMTGEARRGRVSECFSKWEMFAQEVTVEFNRLASAISASFRAGLVEFPSGKALVHLTALQRRSWKPIPWSHADMFNRYGRSCDSLHKMHHYRWRNRSPTASQQSRTVHRSFSKGCYVGVSNVASNTVLIPTGKY